MDIDEIKERVCDMGFENSMFFEDPSYQSAIVGISSNGNVCYSYDAMVVDLMSEDNMTYEEAADFISYNTIRSLDYMQSDSEHIYPIVIYTIE